MNRPPTLAPNEPNRLAPEFPATLEWVNVDAPVDLSALRRRVVLLYFWSYDCVHCINLLRGLRQLENKYADGLTILGVHTPKYPAQQSSAAVLKAVNRNYIRHPVANDARWRTWHQYGIQAWPSILLIDGDGSIAGRFVGEDVLRRVDDALAGLLENAAMRQRLKPSPVRTASRNEPRTPLRFPAHALATPERLYVSDTGHNRVLECAHDGRVLRQFGSGNAGYWDGALANAGFNAPQGLAVSNDTLYVADTGNHCVRRIRLSRGEVETILGTGMPGHQSPGDCAPNECIAVSAPAAVAVSGDRIYVALCRQHQIWCLDLRTRGISVFAGSGRCEERDGIGEAGALAQPSAMAILAGSLLIADAAGNTIRQLRLCDSSLGTLAGGGPYVMGNADGTGIHARFSHPMGVATDGDTLYVADTLNQQVRIIQPLTGKVSTLALDRDLHESQGISFAAGTLWIANRNQHEILRFDLQSRASTRIPVGE